MKLVTGIEAIQSGKRFRYKNPENENDTSDWIDKLSIGWSEEIYSVENFLQLAWEIEREPREFWINPRFDVNGCLLAVKEGDYARPGWIKVREVME